MQGRIQHSTHDECRCAETSEITFDLLDGSDDVLDDVGGCVISSNCQDEISAYKGAFNFFDIIREK